MEIPDSTEIIKTTFQIVIDKNNEINTYFNELNSKKNKLTSLYKQLLNENNSIVNTLDIFNFQIRLLSNDIVYLQQKYNNINNRLYCQYFKIYLQIQEYIIETIPDIQIPKTSFPTYDDTNLNKVYDFMTICSIHEYICSLISALIEYIRIRNNEYKKYLTINNVGVHINVFVDTFKHNIKSKIEQMLLFTNMVRFYNTTGLNYYNKIFNTIEFLHNNISNDISFDILDHISLNPDYIDDTPLQPLENEEYPSPSPSPLGKIYIDEENEHEEDIEYMHNTNIVTTTIHNMPEVLVNPKESTLSTHIPINVSIKPLIVSAPSMTITQPIKSIERVHASTSGIGAVTQTVKPAGPVATAQPATVSQTVKPTAPPATVSQTIKPAAPPATVSQTVKPAAPPATVSQTIKPAGPPVTVSQTIKPAGPPVTVSQTVKPTAPPATGPPAIVSQTIKPTAPPHVLITGQK